MLLRSNIYNVAPFFYISITGPGENTTKIINISSHHYRTIYYIKYVLIINNKLEQPTMLPRQQKDKIRCQSNQ